MNAAEASLTQRGRPGGVFADGSESGGQNGTVFSSNVGKLPILSQPPFLFGGRAPVGRARWPLGSRKVAHPFLPRPRAFYLHGTFGVEDRPQALRNIWRSHPVFTCTQGDVCDATTGQLRGLGNLTSPGPRAGSTAFAPQTQLPLEGSGGWAEGGKGPVFPLLCREATRPCGRGEGSVVPRPGPGTPRGHWGVAWEWGTSWKSALSPPSAPHVSSS